MNDKGTDLPRNLKIGMNVKINPQSDRTRQLLVTGVISDILTNNENHPYGVLVRLESGETGRVKALTDDVASIKKDTETSVTLKNIIDQDENHSVEFKASALWSTNFTNEDIKNHKPQSSELHTYGKNTSKVIISKTIASFLNTDGGTLIIGLQESKNSDENEYVGVENEFNYLTDKCIDGYRRMLVDVVKDFFPTDIFNHLNKYIQINFENINDKTICGITANSSDIRVFLKLKGEDHFFIRTDASTRELHGEEIIKYCLKRFSN